MAEDADLFETPPCIVVTMKSVLGMFQQSTIVWEPFNGRGAISSYLEEQGFSTIKSDKYTMNLPHDFLIDAPPSPFDIIISNPPFVIKQEVVEIALSYGVPTILLMKAEVIITHWFNNLRKGHKLNIIFIRGQCDFVHGNKLRYVGACAWFCFDLPIDNSDTFIIVNQGKDGDIELDESTVGYDFELNECVIEKELTKEGCLIGGIFGRVHVDDDNEDDDEDDDDYTDN